MKYFATAAMLIGLAAASAQAEEARVPDEPVSAGFWTRELEGLKMTPKPPGERWWEVVERDLGCPTYQDGCRVCTSGNCSPVPVACAPAEWKCAAPQK